MNFINNTIVQKKLMAFAGLIWFVYVVAHVLSLSSFHFGKQAFNDFYHWFNGSIIYWPILFVLATTLAFHVFTAVTRQLGNNVAMGANRYHHSYPKIIPRFIAWSGAAMLITFIVFHFVQMQLLSGLDPYQQISNIFTQPVMWLVYIFGLIALGMHLHHGLTNVLQTLGISSNQYNLIAIFIVLALLFGFISIPVSVIYA